jgi:hypothetical protein
MEPSSERTEAMRLKLWKNQGIWDPSNYYGNYPDQLPKSKQVNTYPQGLRPPSKPLVVSARPVTGERVKRVFNFDD